MCIIDYDNDNVPDVQQIMGHVQRRVSDQMKNNVYTCYVKKY